MGPSETHLNSSINQLPCFYEDNKAIKQQMPSYYYNKSNSYQNGDKRKDTKKPYEVSNIVENSNLHATAIEFVPNQTKVDRGTSLNANKNSKSRTNNDHQNQSQEVDRATSKFFFDDNRTKYNDKKFENKRDAGKSWRETQNNQQYKEERKDNGRNQNNRKYQNDKYNRNRNYSEKQQSNHTAKDNAENAVPETSETESSSNNTQERTFNESQDKISNTVNTNHEIDNLQLTNQQSARNSKGFPNNGRGDKYYDRKERYNPKDPRDRRTNYPENSAPVYNPKDPRDRRSNYPENNGYNRNNYPENNGYNRNNYNRDNYNRDNYNRDNKYERRDNRNSFAENRDDKTDWRKRTPDTGNKNTTSKRPSQSKKYEPGMSNKFFKRLLKINFEINIFSL